MVGTQSFPRRLQDSDKRIAAVRRRSVLNASQAIGELEAAAGFSLW
jgi:hypothetical protein